MKTTGGWASSCAVAAVLLLSMPTAAYGLIADYDFSITYTTMTIRGRVVGLTLDDAGNASEADPVRVLLYQLPPDVGLPASDADPYVFVPTRYRRTTVGAGTQDTTVPGVFGFHVSSFQIVPSQQSLLLSDSGLDVFMEFNYGTVFTGMNWGMAAEGDALWPAQSTHETFTLVGGAPRPTAVPDGWTLPGTAMRAGRDGTDIRITWDVASCGTSPNYDAYAGTIGDFVSVQQAACGIGNAGTATIALPGDLVWWVVTGTNGADVGSFGAASPGAERVLGGWAGLCSATQQDVSTTCPPMPR